MPLSPPCNSSFSRCLVRTYTHTRVHQYIYTQRKAYIQPSVPRASCNRAIAERRGCGEIGTAIGGCGARIHTRARTLTSIRALLLLPPEDRSHFYYFYYCHNANFRICPRRTKPCVSARHLCFGVRFFLSRSLCFFYFFTFFFLSRGVQCAFVAGCCFTCNFPLLSLV